MSAFPHAGQTRKQAVPRPKRDRPAARDIPAEDRISEPPSHGEVRFERNIPFSRGKTTEQSFSVNVYTTEDPAAIYRRGLEGVGGRSRPRSTAEDRIIVLRGLRSDPKINRVSGDMEADTSWTIEAVDSETSGKEETPNVQSHYLTPGARSVFADESDREEILYPRNFGSTPLKTQGDFPITSNNNTPKRPLMPELKPSTPSPSAFRQRIRNPRNRSSGESELAQTRSRSSVPQRVASTSSTTDKDKAQDDKSSTRKHRSPHVSTSSPRHGKGKERHSENIGLTTNSLKSPTFSSKTPERHAAQLSRSSSSNVGDRHHSHRVHTSDLSDLPTSPSSSMKHHTLLIPNTPTAQSSSLPQSSKDNKKTDSSPSVVPSPLRSGAQEGWSSLDDVATAEALRKLDHRAGQRARARVHSFGRPSTASSNPSTPAGRTSPPREAVDTSDSGKSKRGNAGGGLKESLSFPFRLLGKSTSRDPQIPISSSSQGPSSSKLSTDESIKVPKQVSNTTKTLDHATHSNHVGTATLSANPPLPAARGQTSSVNHNRPKRLSPSLIPIFRRSSSQSGQVPPATSGRLSSASQNTRLSTDELRPHVGSLTHNGGQNIDFSPPAKPMPLSIVRKTRHYRSSSAPLSVQQLGNGNANETLGSPSSPYASLSSTNNTSPFPIPAPFLPRVRRGYWNRRGDYLTPDGYIVYAPEALAYPAELAAYPLEEEGYQNEEGAFLGYADRPELSASLSWKGRAPERPYESFVIYVDGDSNGSPHWSSIDPFPRGRTPPKHGTKRPSHKKSSSTGTKQELKDEAGSLSQDLPRVVDPWDLDTRLAILNSRRPKSPTSSSSSYGSAHSTRSRASSFSGSAGGHIPGTSRDVLEFPFGYPLGN